MRFMTPEKNENFLFVCLIRDKPLELRRNQQKLTVFFKKKTLPFSWLMKILV